MAEINLLPAKEFEIILADGTVIAGKFGTWAAKRFCDKKKLTIFDLMELMQGEPVLDGNGNPVTIPVPNEEGGTIEVPQMRSKLTLDDVCMLILCAVEYKSRKDKKGFSFSDVDACEWLEEMGGIGSETYNKLMAHADSELPPTEDTGEKKSL